MLKKIFLLMFIFVVGLSGTEIKKESEYLGMVYSESYYEKRQNVFIGEKNKIGI